MKKIIPFFILCLTINTISFSQTRLEKKNAKKEKIAQKFKAIVSLVESGNFKFEADWATPLGNDVANIGLGLRGGGAVFQGGRVNLTSIDNFVHIKNKNADIFLPYFGRVFFPTRNLNDNGINYKGNLDDYSISVNKKKKRLILKFNAKKPNDSIKFQFVINADNGARLTVNSTKRQSISYTGVISELKVKKELN